MTLDIIAAPSQHEGRKLTRAARFAPWGMPLALLLAAGCASSKHGASIELTAPAANQTLSAKSDDTDPNKTGVQYDVTGKATGIGAGTSVNLFIDDKKQSGDARVQTDGKIDMPDMTLPPGQHTIYLQTATGSSSSDKMQKYTLKAVVISAPDNGAVLTSADDKDSNTEGIQINVTVDTYAVDANQSVTLLLDGKASGTAKTDAKGKAVISGVTVLGGSHTLQAQVPDGSSTLDSAEVKVSVQEGCAAINFISPAPPASGMSLTLGGKDSCPTSGSDPFKTTVAIATDAGNGRPVHVIVNGQMAVSGMVNGSTASFDNVVFNKRSGANTLEVQVENSNGDLCMAKFPADIFVDCAGPDCSIASPTPATYVDDKGNTTLYLNHGLTASGGKGFDIQVATSTDVIGSQVELIVDGNSLHPFTADAVADGSAASATFSAVALSEGPHTFEARCTDPTGNQTLSGEASWVVDTVACGVAITAPAASTIFVPGDDTDNATTGTQVVVTSTVTGDDCMGQRSKVCTPSSGITGTDFAAYDGTTPLMSTVTLSDAQTAQSLCVEIEDKAQNVGRGSVAVTYRGSAPGLVIESPADGAKINAKGGTVGSTTYLKDAVTGTTTCDAVFSVACTEVGAQVELHRDDMNGALLGMADCQAPASGDPALPSGYAGRAKITAAPFNDPNQDATVVAVQTLTGSSTKPLLGTSAAVTLHGDCKPPTLVFTNDPCGKAKGNQITLAQAASRDVQVLDGTNDTSSFTFAYTHTDGSGTTNGTATGTLNVNTVTFAAVDLGGDGTATLTVTVNDDFDNSATLMCSTTIVSDLPSVIAVISPANNQAFLPGGQTCNAGSGTYGVLVQAKADQQANRTASVSVNGTVAANNLTIASDGSFQACVAVPDDEATVAGSSAIVVSIASTLGSGHDDVTRTVSVHTVQTTSPADSSTLVAADNCASSGFGYTVVVNVDPSLDGQQYTISSGAGNVMGTVSGAQVSGCVPLAEGPNAITASINGTAIMNTVHVTVDNLPPTHGIVINTPTVDPTSATYRDGVTATWTKPTEDWAGQLVSYQLRCASTAVVAGSENAWWSSATAVSLPSSLTPSTASPSELLAFRPEEVHHCVVRAADQVGQLTPIVQSTDLTLKLRQKVMFAASTATQFGNSVAALGDVDGDHVDDFLVGGQGRAQLFFGVGTSGSPGDPGAAQSVVFLGSDTGVGRDVAGIGDFDGDGFNDFAISDLLWNGFAGRVAIFFGRPKAQWPATISNLDDATSCPADLCLNSSLTGLFGITVRSAGDFDGDGAPDLAIGSPYYPTLANTDGQLLVVLGNKYYDRTCSSNTDCRAVESCQASKCKLTAGRTFWGMQFDIATGNWTDTPTGTPVLLLQGFELDSGGALGGLGQGIASLGLSDNMPGADLAVSAPQLGEVLYLSGRSHSGSAGFDLLHASDLGLRNVTTHVPSGAPLATGSAADLYGAVLASVGDLYSVPGATKVASDLGVCGAASLVDYIKVLPGDPQAASDPGFSASAINVAGNSGYFESIATGQHPQYGLLGDLDADGLPDLLAGTSYSHDAALFYHDTFAAHAASSDVQRSTGVSITLQAQTTNSAGLVVQYVGDFNKDGHQDIVVGDYSAGPTSGQTFGQAILLY